MDRCKTKGCDALLELFSNFCKTKEITNRDYWLFTELFVQIHEGRDYCE